MARTNLDHHAAPAAEDALRADGLQRDAQHPEGRRLRCCFEIGGPCIVAPGPARSSWPSGPARALSVAALRPLRDRSVRTPIARSTPARRGPPSDRLRLRLPPPPQPPGHRAQPDLPPP